MSQQQPGIFRYIATLTIAAAAGIGCSVAIAAICGRGGFSWPQFVAIAVVVNFVLVLGLPASGRHVAENIATSVIFVVLAVLSGLLLEHTLVALVQVTVCGAAAGNIANALCQRLEQRRVAT